MAPTKNKNASGLGRALINNKSKTSRESRQSNLYTTELDGASNLKSVTQENDLDEFLNTARLAGIEFTAEKQSTALVHVTSTGIPKHNRYLLSEQEELAALTRHSENRERLRVPRRPPWGKAMDVSDLERSERGAFLEWRRQLAQLQDNEGFLLTPFERNLEVWRQLWRVVERSDLLVQIVDARNPLKFWCEDLDNYAQNLEGPTLETPTSSHKRRTLLLINKADLLSSSQRRSWAEYFESRHMNYAFYSAMQAVSPPIACPTNPETAAHSDSTHQTESDFDEAEDSEEMSDPERAEPHTDVDQVPVEPIEREHQVKVLSVSELTHLFRSTAPDPRGPGAPVTVGLVGYPNVGKSSTINSLVGAKKVSVSATPGKTKHFQTIHLTKDLIICDCPGLVFPQFATTKADLVCDGVLPIDQLREYTGPITLLVQRIPRRILELTYGLIINHTQDTVTPEDFLTSYAIARGFVRSGQGNPDESRAARYILKDYVNAKLLFSHPPPGISADTFNAQTNAIIIRRLGMEGRRKAPTTRVPHDADTYVPLQQPASASNEEATPHVAEVIDKQFFRPDLNMRAKPFLRGLRMNGQDLSRAQISPHPNMSADHSTFLSDPNTLPQTLTSTLPPQGKKHHKGMKRTKQRSGKGYDL